MSMSETTLLASSAAQHFDGVLHLEQAEGSSMPPYSGAAGGQRQAGQRSERRSTPPLDAAAALAASFGLGFDFGVPQAAGIEGHVPDLQVTGHVEGWERELERIGAESESSQGQSRSPEEIQGGERGEEQPPVDAAAALAASFGFGGIDVVPPARQVPKGVEERGRVEEIKQAKNADATAPQVEERPRKRFKKRTGTTRERTGCLTCRQRRKKCDDNTYPICGHCRRLNLECVREAPRPLNISVGNSQVAAAVDHQRTQSTAAVYATTPAAPHPLALANRRPSTGTYGDLRGVAMEGVDFRVQIPEGLAMPMWDDGTGGDRRYLMKYYTQVLASLVTTNHENNSFLSVFLPMAIDSPPLLSALTAWSCAHLSCFHAPYQTPLLNRRGQALRLVATSLSTPAPSLAFQETLLAATLVLCSLEIIHGDTSSHWLRHLEGAAVIIKNARSGGWDGERIGAEALRGTSDGEWLLRNFAYHDVLGSVTLGKPPLIRGTYWLGEDERTGMVDTYMGVGSRILAFISEASCLQIPSVDVWDSPESRRAFEKKADEIEQGLRSWTAPVAIQPGLVELAEAWRGAALIHLYRRKRAYLQTINPTSALLPQLARLLQQAASKTLTHLAEIPSSSLPESGMLFPIFLAGGETRDAAEMAAIRERMKELGAFRGFRNILKAKDVLEELWRCWGTGVKAGKEANERDVRWEDVCERRGWVLMLA